MVRYLVLERKIVKGILFPAMYNVMIKSLFVAIRL